MLRPELSYASSTDQPYPLSDARGALHALATVGRNTSTFVDLAFASLELGERFRKVDMYRSVNGAFIQRTATRSLTQAAFDLIDHRFLEEESPCDPRTSLCITQKLSEFAVGYNCLNIDLLYNTMPELLAPREMLRRAYLGFAAIHGLPLEEPTPTRLARQTDLDRLSVIHLSMQAWAAGRPGLALGVQATLDQWIKDNSLYAPAPKLT